MFLFEWKVNWYLLALNPNWRARYILYMCIWWISTFLSESTTGMNEYLNIHYNIIVLKTYTFIWIHSCLAYNRRRRTSRNPVLEVIICIESKLAENVRKIKFHSNDENINKCTQWSSVDLSWFNIVMPSNIYFQTEQMRTTI